jgi:hypothetical protein
MIQRIDNVTVLLKPNPVQNEQSKKVAVEVKNESVKSADYLYNPELADKIHESRKSLKEEMGFLKDANAKQTKARQPENVEKYREQDPQRVQQYSALDTLKHSMTRMTSLLYQLASVTAGDSASMEAIQRKLAEELLGYKRVFKGIELTDFESNEIDMDRLRMVVDTEALQITPEDAAATRQIIETAEKSVENTLNAQNRQQSDSMSVTEAKLSNAEQNLAAAESAFYPEEIMDRAKEVARQLYEQMSDTPGTHGTLQPDEVFKLIGAG